MRGFNLQFMPRFYPDALFSDCWSSVGDVTFYHRNGVCYFRSKAYSEFAGTAEQLEQIPGGGIIQDVKDLLEIAETVGEMAGALTDDSDIITHGVGASGSWNKEQNSDIITNGTGASGGW